MFTYAKKFNKLETLTF